jgi:pimeloyl-ACP methyl ester carboxylesterase
MVDGHSHTMPSTVVETDCGPVEFCDAGAGDPILYFHGTGVTGDVMVTVESSLIENGFRLIIPNRPGYGMTPLSPHFTSAACAQVSAALLDKLGVKHVHVMGSSGGAAFAVVFAAKQPDRTRSLVLLCPQLHPWDHKRWLPASSRWTLPFLRRTLLRKLLLALYRFGLRRMTAEKFLKAEAGDRYADVVGDPETQRLCQMTLDAMANGTRYAGFENDFLVFAHDVIVGSQAVITSPVLILHDEKDPVATVEHVNWFTEHYPHCKRIALHAAGHLIWVGPQSDQMLRVRSEFLRQHAARDCPPRNENCAQELARDA